MRYRLWNASQCTKTTPKVSPASSPHQNQDRMRAPASSAMPTATTAAKPATPSSGLVNPNTLAWSVVITEPQLSTGLMLQLGT